MAEHFEVSIDTSNDAPQPTLEELAAKMDEQAPPPAEETNEERPAWLPEKFKSAEDMAAAYAELEKKLGAKSAEKPAEENPPVNTNAEEAGEDQDADPDQTVEEQAQEAADKAGLDLEELSAKYFENGALEEGDYEALEKAGYPKYLVDQFIAGQEAQAALIEMQVFNSVGGEADYKAMLTWAGEELTPGEVNAFNKAVNSNDMDEVMAAVKGLKARFDATVGFEPTRQIKADGKATESVYRSVAELQRDMGDPRYKTDPAFRKDVENKLGRSNIM